MPEYFFFSAVHEALLSPQDCGRQKSGEIHDAD